MNTGKETLSEKVERICSTPKYIVAFILGAMVIGVTIGSLLAMVLLK